MSVNSQQFVSLGANCVVAYWLKEYNLRFEAYPFDWTTVSLESLINELEQNFINYSILSVNKLSPKHLTFENDKPSLIIQNCYKITMAHEVVNPETLNEFSSNLTKRIDRFLNLHNPTFVRLETANLNQLQMEKYDKLIELLDKYFNDYSPLAYTPLRGYKIIVISLGSERAMLGFTQKLS